MKFFIIGLIIFSSFQSLAVCQIKKDIDSSDFGRKNVAYVTIGFGFILADGGFIKNFNYERQICHNILDSKNSLNLKLGYATWEGMQSIAKLCLLSSNFIFGSGSSHFETDIGAAYLFNIDKYESDKTDGITPIINLGYRFQKKNGHFVLRSGTGWPDCIYLSLGFAL